MAATAVKQGQTITIPAAEGEFVLNGADGLQGTTVTLILISGSMRYTTAAKGAAPVIDATYTTITTAGASRLLTVYRNDSIRLVGSGTAEITW